MIFNISNLPRRLSSNRITFQPISKIPKYVRSRHADHKQEEEHRTHPEMELCRLIGNREIVGFGINGQPSYVDSRVFPFPAIRWQESTQAIMALKEKEKGDWKNLREEDKKALYRASFRQTFAEMAAPTGQWKSVFGNLFFILGVAVWMYVFIHVFVHNPIPHTFKPEVQKHQLKRMLDLKVNPICGMSSKWNYNKGEWKASPHIFWFID